MVHPLPWLSAEVVAFKQQLDEQLKKEKILQARRQMKPRSSINSTMSCQTHFAFLGSDVTDHWLINTDAKKLKYRRG